MIFKKKFLLLTLFLIIIFQTLLFTNNNQKTSFRYFNWTVKEISIGKLITISFFSGLFISTLLNNTNTILNKNTLENFDENYVPQSKEEEEKEENVTTNLEMPPQRDIRENKPTISVNYRVVKNTEENNFKMNQDYLNNPDNKDDWTNDEDDW